MCGISGIWKRNGRLEESDLLRFNDSLIHRGPDGSGLKIFDEGLGLAQRRLAILDTSDSGAQPMTDASGRYHITYNGEVFNFLELRKELGSEGHQFRSESDTEVILAAYVQWGIEAFHRFNGMWAIALYDEVEKELLLCRDRYGIKPLYYLDDNDQFAFASETNAFKNLSGFERRVHQQRLQIGLDDTYALEGHGYTLYEDIYQLLPGHFVRFRKGETIRQKRWYDISSMKLGLPSDYDEQVSMYRDLFRDACSLRMRSDVSLATALSGGVDSTAVYSMVHHLMKEKRGERVPDDWQRAFTAVFPGTVQDETEFAKAAVEYTGGSAVYLDPKEDDLLNELISSTKRFDAISATPVLALMTVYKGMRKNGVTVSLDGHGVDEMLYGYRKMVYDAFEYHKWHGKQQDAADIADVLVGLYDPKIRQQKGNDFTNSINEAFDKRGGLIHSLKKGLGKFRRTVEPLQAHDLLSPLSDRPYDFSHLDPLNRMVYEEFFVRTLPSLLRNFDKASMMHSTEIRMPFMDYRMVEYSFALPLEAKLGGGYTKRILRDAMKGIMPEANRARTFKVGLAAPTMEWFEGPLSEWLNDLVHSKTFLEPIHWSSEDSKSIVKQVEASDWSVPSASEAWKYINAHLILDAE